MIDELVAYAARWNPEFAEQLRGATPVEISRLEKLIETRIPESYREFLLRMGHSDDALNLAWAASTDILEVIDYYEEVARGDLSPPPKDCIVISGEDPAVGRLLLEQVAGQPEPRVVISSGGPTHRLHAETLEHLLYHAAAGRYRMAAWSLQAWLRAEIDGPGMLEAIELGRSLGFAREWFSDAALWCGESPDATMMIRPPRENGTWVRIGTASPDRLEHVRRQCMDRLGMSVME